MRQKPQPSWSKNRSRRPEKAGKRPGHRPAGAAKRPNEAQGYRESQYLKGLARERAEVLVKLHSNEEFEGVVEYYDSRFLRLTREDGPNLFVFKHDIKYLVERPRGAARDGKKSASGNHE